MKRRLASVAYLAPSYDEGIAFFCDCLGFALIEDVDLGAGKRWVVVAPEGGGASLVIAQADGDRQKAAIGEAAGGRVAFFLETNDFDRDHRAFQANGVKFLEIPRREAYGTVAVFRGRVRGQMGFDPARGAAFVSVERQLLIWAAVFGLLSLRCCCWARS